MTRVETLDGVTIAVVEQGPHDGMPVVLAHSLGASHAIWGGIVTGLIDAGYRVIRYDLRGHGGSGAPEGPYNAELFGRDLIAVLDGLGIARAHVGGLSVGGMAAMWTAVNAPERIDRLVLANTTAFIPAKDRWDPLIAEARSAGLEGIAPTMILGWLSAGFVARDPAKASALVEAMRTMPPEGFAGTCAVLRDVDLRDDLARIQAPTLIIHGVEDARGEPASAGLNAGIAGSFRSDIPDAAHLSPAENPDAVRDAILQFLS